jgi:hypothetical protein
VPDTFLFRFDGARENDEFLNLARSKGHLVYAGLAMQLQRGWIPDFVEVSLDEKAATCTITIVELESTEGSALVSARKYLPESSKDILSIFQKYLLRVLQKCRTTADPRVEDIQRVLDGLAGSTKIGMWSAGALRQLPRIVERLPLIDQGRESDGVSIYPQAEARPDPFEGEISLSARQHKNLSRSILILDALIRGWDNSGASLRAWRSSRSQPLRRYVEKHSVDFPTLSALLIGQKTGSRLMIEDVAREVSVIWNGLQPDRHTEATVRAALSRFMPIDLTLDPNAPVRIAFEKARLIAGTSIP